MDLRPDQLLAWSKPVRKMTQVGPKMVSEANASKAFWDAWRADKEALRAAGLSPKKIGERWIVYRYQPLPESELVKEAEAVEQSRAADADVDVPCPDGLSYLPYQRAGIAYGMSRDAVLIADEMGLGKTIQAIGIANASSAKRILVICPASLKLNWAREMSKWLTGTRTIGVVVSGKPFPATQVAIINYELLKKFRVELRTQPWDLLVADEAHYLKNSKAQRTIEVVGSSSRSKDKVEQIPAKRRVLLTGTPIVNRPIELWPLVHYLNPAEYKNFFAFAKRYCNGHNNGYGWDFSGHSNLPELQNRLRASLMIRRMKADVLTDLPAKRRQIIALEPDEAGRKAIAAEQAAEQAHEAEAEALMIAVELAKASEDPTDYQNAVNKLRDFSTAKFAEIGKLRYATAMAKLPTVLEHVADSMDDGKVIVMCHHKDVVRKFQEVLAERCVVITGDTPMEDRQAAVDRFQTDETCRVFVGTIRAAGVGLTLTASSHVVFAELDWTPGAMSQAEDRAHRIGQRDSVLVQHLVLDGSIDARLASTLVSKQAVADKALDKRAPSPTDAPVEPEVDVDMLVATAVTSAPTAATRSASRDKIAEIAKTLTSDQIAAIHSGLQMLAAMDADRAGIRNDKGFSKIDGSIGHSLAEREVLTPKQAALGLRLVTKYRGQLPATLVRHCVANAGAALSGLHLPLYAGVG